MLPSKYMGIEWNAKKRSWEVRDPQSGEIIGHTREEIRAAKEYDEYVLLKYGLDSATNFPAEEYKLAIEFGKDATCKKRGKTLPVNQFYKHPDNRGRRDCYCIPCRNLHSAETKAIYRSRVREKSIELKSVPCADCGIQYPHYVMQFHHIDPYSKSIDIPKCGSVSRLIKEVSKCVVLCANCHLEREWGENGLSKLRIRYSTVKKEVSA